MKINPKYTSRHQLLKTLQERKDEKWSPDMVDIRDIALPYHKLESSSGLSENQVVEQIQYLINENEIIKKEIKYDWYYYISDMGSASYYDSKYPSKGKKEYLDNIYDILKNVSTFLLLLMAVITFIGNWVSNSKNNAEIEKIKTELNQLKDSIQNEKQGQPKIELSTQKNFKP